MQKTVEHIRNTTTTTTIHHIVNFIEHNNNNSNNYFLTYLGTCLFEWEMKRSYCLPPTKRRIGDVGLNVSQVAPATSRFYTHWFQYGLVMRSFWNRIFGASGLVLAARSRQKRRNNIPAGRPAGTIVRTIWTFWRGTSVNGYPKKRRARC